MYIGIYIYISEQYQIFLVLIPDLQLVSVQYRTRRFALVADRPVQFLSS